MPFLILPTCLFFVVAVAAALPMLLLYAQAQVLFTVNIRQKRNKKANREMEK